MVMSTQMMQQMGGMGGAGPAPPDLGVSSAFRKYTFCRVLDMYVYIIGSGSRGVVAPLKFYKTSTIGI